MKPLTADASTARVLWVIATADAPLTGSEISEYLDVDRNAVYHSTRRLYISGLLIRRKRPRDGGGRRPFEYAVAPREEGP